MVIVESTIFYYNISIQTTLNVNLLLTIYFSRGIVSSRNYADYLGTRPDRVKYFLEIIFVKIVFGNVFRVPLKMRSTTFLNVLAFIII